MAHFRHGDQRFLLASLVIALLAAGCTEANQHAGEVNAAGEAFQGRHPIRAVCTTGMVADLVKNVGGQWVTVEALMGEGVDPHLYKTSPGDLAKLDQADVIFYSGLHLEGKMSELLERLGHRKRTVAVTAGIVREKLLSPAGEAAADPHVWMDVTLWTDACRQVRDSLVQFDPPHADDYAANFQRYSEQLVALDAECRSAIGHIPEPRRVLVTAHDAFSYFGRAYQIEVRAIQGISTESEAGVREVNALVEFLSERKIKAVFVETSVSDRNIQALIEGSRARGHSVLIGGALYSDAMGASGTPEGTYIGMIRKNVQTIVDALK